MIYTDKTFSKRMKEIPESFIREILKVAEGSNMISFAGGLPNPNFFPVQEIAAACEKVMRTDGKSLLQYSVSEGYMPLRAFLAERQEKKSGERTSPEQILILNGSQQGIDLSSKVFLNEKDKVLLEAPSYLGAIQSFSTFRVKIDSVKMEENGISIPELDKKLKKDPKIFYCIPSYQNPTGITYSLEKRIKVAEMIRDTETIIIEDNPYGEIYFGSNSLPEIQNFAADNTVLLGSFSKMISPGLRLGWAVAPEKFIQKLTICKQASDLHSNIFSQRILYQYLLDNDLDDHLNKIRSFYKKQRNQMINLIKIHFPEQIRYVLPQGGMFLWIHFPESINTLSILKQAMAEKIIFVPGSSFYLQGQEKNNCMRLNFSNPTYEEMERGIKILGDILKGALDN